MNRIVQYKVGDSEERPWGAWAVLAAGSGFVIKKIDVNPEAILSLQSHAYRDEHWVVLTGEAEVTIGAEISRLKKNASVFIPKTKKHRIKNIGEGPLSFIEVQTGDVLNESDIIRYDDIYGRAAG